MDFRGEIKKLPYVGDFELRTPENTPFWHLGNFELRNDGMPKISCFLNARN